MKVWYQNWTRSLSGSDATKSLFNIPYILLKPGLFLEKSKLQYTKYHLRFSLKNMLSWAEELVQWFGVLATLAEDLVSIPILHMAAHKHQEMPVPGYLVPSSGLNGYFMHGAHINSCKHTHRYIKIINI